MKKISVFGTMALTGAALHMGSNLGMKILKSTHRGHQLESALIAKGIENGMKGRNVDLTTRRLATFGVGPEAMVPHDIGHALGSKMNEISPGRRKSILKNLRRRLASEPDLLAAPNGSSMLSAFNQVIGGNARPKSWASKIIDRMPSVLSGQKPTTFQRVLTPALGAAVIAASPTHAGVHLGINAGRLALAKSRFGASILENQLNKGLSGKKIHFLLNAATDIAVSPSALDTRRLGLAVRSAAENRGLRMSSRINIRDILSKF